ncbi:MAG: hypothetical protein E6H04_05290 [Bacillati bacterium ANGP1]|uniref:Uncharacterized protein n=1 Tax=Candidatus Segetimicrobium genomatis TaxID=2569760 RepID=A0A537JF98_9BACT|nr:MAG: hypothetical protein E6H04_05290 [Terrabacteria group bacterium ANGP1]
MLVQKERKGQSHHQGKRILSSRDSSLLALRAEPNPLSSVEAFDEFVGSYAEVGIEEFIFYWPPVKRDHKEPISSSQQAMFERIAAERLAPLRRPDA